MKPSKTPRCACCQHTQSRHAEVFQPGWMVGKYLRMGACIVALCRCVAFIAPESESEVEG